MVIESVDGKNIWGDGKAKRGNQVWGPKNWDDSVKVLVGHELTVLYWTCKAETLIRCNNYLFVFKQMTEWLLSRAMVDQSNSLFGKFAWRSWRKGGSCRRSQERWSQPREAMKSQNYKEINSESERKPVGG